jgi:hypothetical protein
MAVSKADMLSAVLAMDSYHRGTDGAVIVAGASEGGGWILNRRQFAAAGGALTAQLLLSGCDMFWTAFRFRWTVVVALDGVRKSGSSVFEIAVSPDRNRRLRCAAPMIDLGGSGRLYALVLSATDPPEVSNLPLRCLWSTVSCFGTS